jgi:hypothetical protein
VEKVEKVLMAEQPDVVVVYGDTNSTLGGGLAAAKLNIPVAHVEAGLRSRRRDMPEEINLVLTDHLSSLLFCPSPEAGRNLRREGLAPAGGRKGKAAEGRAMRLYPLGVSSRQVAEFVDHASGGDRVIFPMHPRTRKSCRRDGVKFGSTVEII